MQALQMTMTLILPTVFFSGFIFPRETMPAFFYYFGSALPTTYYINLLRGIILRGAYLEDHIDDRFAGIQDPVLKIDGNEQRGLSHTEI